jgi:hypothetical protein
VFDLTDITNENRRKWLDRMKKEDPRHASLFCFDCTRFIGGSRIPCPDCNPKVPKETV